MRKRVIIVTGASRGLGREIALRFGKAGDSVLVNYLRDRDAALGVADAISREGGSAIVHQADIRQSEAVNTMIEAAYQRWDRIDVLVNNAGIVRDQLMVRMTEHEWDDVVNTDLTGAFYCIRAVSKHMVYKKHGHIINIASISGVHGREGQANYAAAKAGLIGLTKSAAKELGESGIRVNAILPGYLQSDMVKQIPRHIHDSILCEHVLGRLPEMHDTADFVHYLAFMNNVSGQVFNLDSRIL